MQKWTAQEVKKSYKLMAASYIIVLQLHEWRAKLNEDNWQQFYYYVVHVPDNNSNSNSIHGNNSNYNKDKINLD